ncbi:MAG TPA: hypothetical protein VHO68_02905, partial [Bacteroidales bacterium]|nr:hypothetical protein [Bacteroidales bacterium]
TSSEELASQAQQLLEMIAFFKLNHESGRKSYELTEKAKSISHVAHVTHIEKPAARQAEHPKVQKGVKINMGRDNLDSQYEKF